LDILHRELFHGIAVVHVIGAVILIFVLNFVWKMLRPKKRPDVYDKVRCLECDWTGDVSRYHRVCRKCGGETLQNISEG